MSLHADPPLPFLIHERILFNLVYGVPFRSTSVEMITFTSVFGKNSHVMEEILCYQTYRSPRATMTPLITFKRFTVQAQDPAASREDIKSSISSDDEAKSTSCISKVQPSAVV